MGFLLERAGRLFDINSWPTYPRRMQRTSVWVLLSFLVLGQSAQAAPWVVQSPADLALEVSERSALWCDPVRKEFGARDGKIARADFAIINPNGVRRGVENRFYLWMLGSESGIRVDSELRLFAFDESGEMEIGQLNVPIYPAPPTNPDGFFCDYGRIALAPGVTSQIEVEFTGRCEWSMGIWRPVTEWSPEWTRPATVSAVFSANGRTVRIPQDKQTWIFGEGFTAQRQCRQSE